MPVYTFIIDFEYQYDCKFLFISGNNLQNQNKKYKKKLQRKARDLRRYLDKGFGIKIEDAEAICV